MNERVNDLPVRPTARRRAALDYPPTVSEGREAETLPAVTRQRQPHRGAAEAASRGGSSNGGKSKAKKRGRAGRASKRIAIIVIILAVGAGGFMYWRASRASRSAAGGQTWIQAAARQGPLDVTVYGSGMIQAASQPVVLAGTEGTVQSLRVSVGDTAQKGGVLAILTNSAVDDDVRNKEYALWDLDRKITDAAAGAEVGSVKAPSAGRVMKLYVQTGDDALAVYREHSAVAVLSIDGRMKVEFEPAEGAQLTLGGSVTVSGDGFSRAAVITELYLHDTRAVATVLDDTLPMDAQVTVGLNGFEVGRGVLEINKPMAVSAFGGTVRDVRVKEGDQVAQRSTLFTLDNAPNSLEMESLRMQREAAADALAKAREAREALIVTAPCDGVIATLNIAEGDAVKKDQNLLSVLEGEEMRLTIAIDELDVVKVESGQPVTISVDALPQLSLRGEVEKIAPVGSGGGGVSTYDVSLRFEASGTGVKPGMNASGAVRVAYADSALYVPVEALMTIGNQTFVRVAGSSGTPAATQPPQNDPAVDGQNNADAAAQTQNRRSQNGGAAGSGYNRADGTGAVGAGAQQRQPSASQQAAAGEGTLRPVTVGIRNDDYAEITSGLSAGEVVMYQAAGSSSSGGGSILSGIRMPGLTR